MTIALAILLALLSNPQVTAHRFNFKSQVGVVDNQLDQACLVIQNPNLAVGTPLSFVTPHRRQSVVKATIAQKLSKSCSRNAETGTDGSPSFYLLKLTGSHPTYPLDVPQSPAIALINPISPVTLRGGVAGGDVDGDGRTETFRICTSNEGQHLSIWSGKALQGKRRWHFYYYLGYDVVPSCHRKDYQ
jgi:hypothetical protein